MDSVRLLNSLRLVGLRAVVRALVPVVVAAGLLVLVIANVRVRASWLEAEDGVLWAASPEGVVARELSRDGAGARAGLAVDDLLVAIDGRRVDIPGDVYEALHSARPGDTVTYTVLRGGVRQGLTQLTLHQTPSGYRTLYMVQALVAIFTLLVGCAVRLRRPGDQASLHFFWLSVAFFGVFGFSFSGRLDRLDWVFYWGDVVALLLLPPLFLHFALVFPERPRAWVRTPIGRAVLPLFYLPALLLGGLRAAILLQPSGLQSTGGGFTGALETLDRIELLVLAAGLLGGLGIMVRALRRVRSMTARRQLRWIVGGTVIGGVPFLAGYGLPWAAGFDAGPQLGFLTIPLGFLPLAFASAVVRYRLMDVEVIIKRTVVYAAAITAIATIYAVLLKLAGQVFADAGGQSHTIMAVLATLVVVLLAPLVKNTIQTLLDRAYYRDRYDYRRALVAFARELNTDLDLQRLSERLVDRVVDTLVLDRMCLLLTPVADETPRHFVAARSVGFLRPLPPLDAASGIGSRVRSGQTVNLDEPFTMRRFTVDEVSHWQQLGVHCFVPCVSKEGTIAVMALGGKESGEPLNSEDMALLEAVAAQVATAFENGRLYHQLQLKAAELDRERRFNENVIESLDDGLLVAGLDERVVRWNPSLERLYGLPRAEAVGRRLDELFDGELLSALRAHRVAAAAGQPSNVSVLYRVPIVSRHADGGRPRLVNVAEAPLRDVDGRTAGTIVILEDITSRVQLEEQLQISEKMASVGLLAAGVAHEVNTPLTGISSFTQMLLEGADPDDARTKLLEKIERQTFRAAKIVNGLLNLARPPQTDVGPIDLHAVIADVLSLLEHQFRNGNVQVRKDLSTEALIVPSVEHKLQQIFLNLFINARDAMPKGGWLSISTRIDGGQAVIEVADTGAGIPADHLSRIYDPFFTTKPIGQGTGLGLSITYGIVRENGGVITCESAEGKGTTFRLLFPLAQDAAALRAMGRDTADTSHLRQAGS
jgi:two-component system NtrC family sensor kinase